MRNCSLTSKTRLAFVAMLLVAGSGVARGEPRHPVPPPLSGTVLYEDVVRYFEIGNHRTGSPGDQETSRWLADELTKVGLSVEMDAFKLRQFRVVNCSLLVDGRPVACFPFWYPRNTGESPIIAPLAILGDNNESVEGRIAIMDARPLGLSPWQEGVNSIAERATKAGAKGLVVSYLHSCPRAVSALNAKPPFHQTPLPIPAVGVAIDSLATLTKAAEDRATATIRIEGVDDVAAESANVIGRLKRGSKWIVVTTPTTGWFKCGGERGPGIALFLALARWAAQSESELSFLFMANSGHELDYMGARQSLERFAPSPEEVIAWIHLGSSIATRKWECTGDHHRPIDQLETEYGRLDCTRDLIPILEDTFRETACPRPSVRKRAGGELGLFIESGYRAFGLYGAHHYFHVDNDAPTCTLPQLLQEIAEGFRKAIVRLDREAD